MAAWEYVRLGVVIVVTCAWVLWCFSPVIVAIIAARERKKWEAMVHLMTWEQLEQIKEEGYKNEPFFGSYRRDERWFAVMNYLNKNFERYWEEYRSKTYKLK
jgi:hypothetical protein